MRRHWWRLRQRIRLWRFLLYVRRHEDVTFTGYYDDTIGPLSGWRGKRISFTFNDGSTVSGIVQRSRIVARCGDITEFETTVKLDKEKQ